MIESNETREPKVAIVHHWLVTMRGGERVVETLCNMYPQAEIFTHVYTPERVSDTIRSRKVHTSFINRLPFVKKLYQWYLPLMPLALEAFDFSEFDIVITSDSGPVKGVLTSEDTLNICYCYTPMRYIWGMQATYLAGARRAARIAFPAIAHYMRLWDYAAAARVDHFIAISNIVSRRIAKVYRRKSTIIFPPVDCDAFASDQPAEDFYLLAGQLVAYKRPELAVEACNRLGRKLIVIGEGEKLASIRRLAGPTVTVMGAQPNSVMKDHFSRCRALIFPGVEDFGIVPVEAMACGKPVIALAKGGALDTVLDNITGVLFSEPTVECLIDAIQRFELAEGSFDRPRIVDHARKFDASVFEKEFRAFVDEVSEAHRLNLETGLSGALSTRASNGAP